MIEPTNTNHIPETGNMVEVKMPEPTLVRTVFHHTTGEVEQSLITTEQAEAYAEARVWEWLWRRISKLY